MKLERTSGKVVICSNLRVRLALLKVAWTGGHAFEIDQLEES